MRVRINILAAIVFLACALSSCLKEEGILIDNPPEEGGKSMTLIVYMGGDNNLSGETYAKIRSIATTVITGLGGNSNIIIYQDQLASSGDTPRMWKITSSGTQVISNSTRLEEMTNLRLIESYKEEDSSSPEVLSRVIDRAVKIAPAESYGLWVFSHASGWLPAGAYASPQSATTRSMVQDGNNEMELEDFARAIPDGLFEYIVMEMCFMSGVETLYELRNKADYIVASCAEIVSPGFTELYGKVLPPLFDPSVTTLTALEKMITEYYNHCDNKSGWLKSGTISLIKTASLETLASVTQKIFSNGTRVDDISGVQSFDRSKYKLFFDFKDYVSQMATPAQQEELTGAIDRTVHMAMATNGFMTTYQGFMIDSYCGLTSYIPQDIFPALNQAYYQTSWAQRIGIR